MTTQPSTTEVPGLRRYWIDETFEVPVSQADAFALLSDFKRWPSWAPGIRRFAPRGAPPLAPGSHFYFVVKIELIAFKLLMPCQFYRIDPECIEWGLGALGNYVRHRFELSAIGPTTTRVRHAEYASNAMAIVGYPFAGIARKFNQSLSRAVQRQLSTPAPETSRA